MKSGIGKKVNFLKIDKRGVLIKSRGWKRLKNLYEGERLIGT